MENSRIAGGGSASMEFLNSKQIQFISILDHFLRPYNNYLIFLKIFHNLGQKRGEGGVRPIMEFSIIF